MPILLASTCWQLAVPIQQNSASMIKPGILVALSHGRDRGIVSKAEGPPPEKWILEQIDESMREHRDDRWWSVMPLTGGALLLPESLLRPLGEPSYEDFLIAVDHANETGRRTLASLFPDMVAKVIREAGHGT